MYMVVFGGFDRFHLQFQADQIGRQRTQQQVGVLGIAIFDIHADHQLVVADLLNPDFPPLPHHGKAGAGGLQLGAVYIFKDQLQAIAHGHTLDKGTKTGRMASRHR